MGAVDRRLLTSMLEAVARGEATPADAAEALARLPVADLGFARLDTHRTIRTGVPEAIWCPGKTPEQLRGIAVALLEVPGSAVLGTKAAPEQFEAVRDLTPEASFEPRSGTIVLRRAATPLDGCVAVVTGGTSDLPIAEEAAVCAEAFGARVDRVVDVGVAGVHRTLAAQDRLRAADVLVVVAGMEGALPSLVAGLTAAPVVAVPTSVGYGASLGGLAALLGMLTSCAPGVAVMNIDNGFGAAAVAARILGAGR